MKLRNKKTGEILESLGSFIIQNPNSINCEAITNYDSLAKLNEDWEDYEGPKEVWTITLFGEVQGGNPEDIILVDPRLIDRLKEIGNYFETREEAEKAVEKLKAWKRLKDKGFEFCGVAGLQNAICFKANESFTHIMVDEYTADETEKEYINDLMLLFGGEDV